MSTETKSKEELMAEILCQHYIGMAMINRMEAQFIAIKNMAGDNITIASLADTGEYLCMDADIALSRFAVYGDLSSSSFDPSPDQVPSTKAIH